MLGHDNYYSIDFTCVLYFENGPFSTMLITTLISDSYEVVDPRKLILKKYMKLTRKMSQDFFKP